MKIVDDINDKEVEKSISRIVKSVSKLKDNLEGNEILLAIKECNEVLKELEQGGLSPRNYYIIYTQVVDLLENVSLYFEGQQNRTLIFKDEERGIGLDGALEEKERIEVVSEYDKWLLKLKEIYVLVQYTGEIVPRLYLMILVGSSIFKYEIEKKIEIIRDIAKHLYGVQDPLKGIFLRHYFFQKIKNYLPCSTFCEFEESNEFLIENFVNTNQQWRIFQERNGHNSAVEHIKNDDEVKMLIGLNLVHIIEWTENYFKNDIKSKLEYYDLRIIPFIMTKVFMNTHTLLHFYFFDILIHSFSCFFLHFYLEKLLVEMVRKKELKSKVMYFLNCLVTRFMTENNFDNILNDDNSVDGINLNQKNEIKELLWKYYLDFFHLVQNIDILINTQFLINYLNLITNFNYMNFDIINSFFDFIINDFGLNNNEKKIQESNNDLEQKVKTIPEGFFCKIALVVVDKLIPIKNLSFLKSYYFFYLNLLEIKEKKKVSVRIFEKLFESSCDRCETKNLGYDSTFNSSFSLFEINCFITYLIPLIDDKINLKNNFQYKFDQSNCTKVNKFNSLNIEDFFYNQELVSKFLVFIAKQTDTFQSISILLMIKKRYLVMNLNNVIYTYPTLISNLLNKIISINSLYELTLKQIESNHELTTDCLTKRDFFFKSFFQELSIIFNELNHNHPILYLETVLNLNLILTLISDQLKLDYYSLEFFNTSFIIYEERLFMNHIENTLSNLDVPSISYYSLTLIINLLNNMKSLTFNNFEKLCEKITFYSTKLLKKEDQTRAIFYCMNLWWSCVLMTQDKNKDNTNLYLKKFLLCLEESKNLAISCIDPFSSSKLLIEILNYSFFSEVCQKITECKDFVIKLIKDINIKLETLKKLDMLCYEKKHNSFENLEKFYNVTLNLFDDYKILS